MEVKVKLSNIIARCFNNVHIDIKNNNHTHYWLKGGRGSTKSSFISIELILGIMKDPRANAVVLMKVKDYIRDQAFEQLKWAIDTLEVNNSWKVNTSPLMMTYLPTGQKILFRGGDDPKKLKGTKFATGYCKFVWYEEVDAFDSMNDLRTINQSLLRGENIKPIVFYTFNPPKSKNNWVNQEVINQELRQDTLVHHSTYLMVPPKWLGEVFIMEAEHLKETKPRAYEHEYLGKAVGTGGNIFDNVTIREISDKEIAQFDKIRQGCDWGYAVDAFAYTKTHYDKTRKRLYMFDEIYKVGLSNAKAAEEMKNKNKENLTIIADSSEPKSIDEVKGYGLKIKGAKKGPGSVETGMKYLQGLEEIIIDPRRCPNTKWEFTSYEYERDKQGKFKSRYPDKDNHLIDACRYALSEDIINNRIRIRNF